MPAIKGFIARAGFAMILFVLGSALQPAWGQTCNFYVSPTGSESNVGTLAAPWQTVEKAFTDSSVVGGCTVYFMEGVYSTGTSYVANNCGVGTSDGGHDEYSQILAKSRSSGNPITFTNYPGQVAIIQGDMRIGTSSCSVSYVTFQGTSALATGAWGLVFEQCP